MENRYRMQLQGSSRWRSSEEFQEADVWGSISRDRDDSPSYSMKDPSSFISSKSLPTASRMIPKSSANKKSTSLQDPKIVQHSAPLNIPDWSKIYRTTTTSNNSYYSSNNNDRRNNIGEHEHGLGMSSWESDDDDDEGEEDVDGEGNMIPPHQWVARRQISSFSVCEGAGRTLKGRDLSRVRNDVLTKTGFLESNHSKF